jgi:hypothetical protein
MSDYDDLSGTTLGGKLGCLASALVGLPTLGVLMFLAFYGDCFDSEQCHRGEGLRWVFVILLTFAVAAPVGLLTRGLVNRWNQSKR